jgi:NAD(P)-dependent dehydrogenase (short-subunit alcohol dehydrogenase family)
VEGKVAFITGGSSGIGLGIARACAEAGMKVVIGYRTQANVDEAMRQLGGAGSQVYPMNVDVTDRRRMEDAAAETVEAFGRVHMLVNNAGVIAGTTLGESTYDDWDWGLSVNVTGIFNGLRAFLPHTKVHGEGGQIVTTSSVLGLVVSSGIGIYSTSKCAAVGMMEALRAELADINIGVSVFCPGYVKSDLWDATRNRPDRFADTATKPLETEERGRIRAEIENWDESAMDPREAGQLVLRGIRNNDLYILTHPEFEQGIRDRNEALIASIPRDLHTPNARVAAELEILRNPFYVAERDRKQCDGR